MWVPKQDDENPYNRSSQTNSPSVGSGGGAPLGSGTNSQTISNPSTQNPINQTPQQKPATVQDYLKANTQQGQDLSTKFNNNLEDTFNTSKNAVDTAANNVKGQVSSSTQYNPDVVNEAISTPESVLGDSNKLTSFLKQWQGNYGGPSSFESTTDYSSAADAANKAKEASEEVKTTGGRKQFLHDNFGVYGQGNQGLDQTLLQNSPDFATTQSYTPKLASIQDYLGQVSNDINNGVIPGAKNAATVNANKEQSDFNQGRQAFESEVNSNATSGIDPANLQMWDAVANAYAGQPGFALPVKNPGVDIARYLTATPEERAKDAAYAQLSGTNSGLFPTAPQTQDLTELQTILNSFKKK